MKYCKYENIHFQEAFDGYLRLIVDLIKSHVQDNLVSILLIGGYGRGEGTIMLQGNSASPVNDIDLAVVSHKRIEKDVLKHLMMDAARIVKPDTRYVHDGYCKLDFHVDIFNLKEEELLKLTPSQFNYDLKYASMVIYGDQVLSRIPGFKSEQIPTWDGLLLLFNRCMSLAEIFSPDCIIKREDIDQADWIYYFAIKGIIDSAAALLILLGRYVPFHEERIEILKSMSGNCSFLRVNQDLLPLFDEYTRKSFVIKDVDFNNPLEHWCLSRDILLKTLDYYLSQAFLISPSDSLLKKTEGFIASRMQERRSIKRQRKLNRQTLIALLRLPKHIIGKMLYTLYLRKIPPALPNIDFIFAAAPCLLSALNIGVENGRAVAQVDSESLDQVQKYMCAILPQRKSAQLNKQDDNGLHRWFLFRDVLVDTWKSSHW
jgi:hypothetical protein